MTKDLRVLFFLGRIMSPWVCSEAQLAALFGKKKPARGGFLMGRLRPNHFSLISLYSTCLRALGSNFMIDIFSGMVFLFLLVV